METMRTICFSVLIITVTCEALAMASKQSSDCYPQDETVLLQMNTQVVAKRGNAPGALVQKKREADVLESHQVMKNEHDDHQSKHRKQTAEKVRDFEDDEVADKEGENTDQAASQRWKALETSRLASDLTTQVKHALRAIQVAQGSGENGTAGTTLARWMGQFFFAFAYFLLVVSKYPSLGDKLPNEEAKALQILPPLNACLKSTPHNQALGFCCAGPRAAHTFDKTGIVEYWPACIAMTLFPCCTLALTHGYTEINVKLGGNQMDCMHAFLCGFFCSCCMVSQDAEALDAIMGMETGCCGVYEKAGSHKSRLLTPDASDAEDSAEKTKDPFLVETNG